MAGKRQSIINAIKARAATILIVNGYQTNIGGNVKEWHLTQLEPADLPAILISDPNEEADIQDVNSGHYTRKLHISLDVVLVEADRTAAKARQAIEDVIAMIGKDPKWSGLARRSVPITEDVTVDKEGQQYGGAHMEFYVEYGRKPWEA